MRQEKSILTAYILWLLAGSFAAHRFYLGRPGSAIVMALLVIGGAIAAAYGHLEADKTYLRVGLVCLALGVTGLLADLIMIPGMVESANAGPDSDRSFVTPGANLDPSFQATARHAGLDDEKRPAKRRIPEGYEMPWRKEADTEPDRYKPGDD